MSEAYTLTRDQLETVLRSTYAAGEQAGESPLSAAGDERRFRRAIDAAVARAAEYTARKPTNETTPDAVEAAIASLVNVLVNEYSHTSETASALDVCIGSLRHARRAERARHAEEVARLEARVAKLADCARNVADERDSLRDQLRRVEGERDALAVRMDLPASQLLMVGSELCGDGKIDPNDHRDPRWTPTLQRAAEVMRELTARRALDADVMACAERCRDTLIGPPGMPVEDYPLAPEALAARRILAALDSHECPECHMPGHHKMSCSRGGSTGARVSVSPREGGE